MTELVIQQRIAASRATVYHFLTRSEQWSKWQGSSATIDPRPGGLFSMVMGNGMNARGEFLELVPDRRVVFTWGWIDSPGIPPGSTIVEIDLEDDETGTLLVLTHRELPEDEVAVHRLGWSHHLPRLAEVASGGDPGTDSGPGE